MRLGLVVRNKPLNVLYAVIKPQNLNQFVKLIQPNVT